MYFWTNFFTNIAKIGIHSQESSENLAMNIQWINHDTGDHDSWGVYHMLLPAAVHKLLWEAGRLPSYHSGHTLHLRSRDKTVSNWSHIRGLGCVRFWVDSCPPAVATCRRQMPSNLNWCNLSSLCYIWQGLSGYQVNAKNIDFVVIVMRNMKSHLPELKLSKWVPA